MAKATDKNNVFPIFCLIMNIWNIRININRNAPHLYCRIYFCNLSQFYVA